MKKCLKKIVVLAGISGMFTLACGIASAQVSRNTGNSPDKALKSNARVNPSTLAMELSIPITGYQGRAGNGFPLSIDYSSKVWEIMAYPGSWTDANGSPITDTRPVYAKRSAQGWTSSTNVPRIEYKLEPYLGNVPAAEYEGAIYKVSDSSETLALYYVKRLRVQMPDGGSHEFRVDDAVHNCGLTTTGGCTDYDLLGTYYSVDGTRMKLESETTQSTLYLSDGSRYLFAAVVPNADNKAYRFIDRNGNKMDYDAPNKRWTDTLGRVIEDPLDLNDEFGSATRTVSDETASFPGTNGATFDVTFSWRYLKDPNNGESGIDDPAQSLA